MDKITALMENFIANRDITGAAVRVCKKDRAVFDGTFGYTDVEGKIPVGFDTIYPLCSMSKPITGIAVMQLVEQGKLSITDTVDLFIPEFAELQVAVTDSNGVVRLEKAKRMPNIYDLLNHSSGICTGSIQYGGMVYAGMNHIAQNIHLGMSLEERVKIYASAPADFHPGEGTGYSAFAGFDILGYIVECVSGMQLNEYIQENIMKPLGIRDLTFTPDADQQSRMARIINRVDGVLVDETETTPFWAAMNPVTCGYHAGSGGMLGTLDAYSVIARMLLGGGAHNGVRILKEETVRMMAGKTVKASHRFEPEAYWGLSMACFDCPNATGRSLEPGSFGWSGAMGTHFYVDPKNDLCVVLMTCGGHLMGGASYVSHALEKAVYDSFVR